MLRLDSSTWKKHYLMTLKDVQLELQKPFEDKLKRTKQLIRMFAQAPNACVSCSFGKDSMVVLHLALEVNPRIPINFNNTLIEFPETMRLMRKFSDEWDLNIAVLRPAPGINFWKINERITRDHLRRDDGKKHSNICCWHLKEKPFKLWRVERNINKCFTGITALESRNRLLNVACMKGTDYYNCKDGLYKIHPILYWTEQEVWDFTKDMGLPVNEAYACYGLKRIGCMYCMSHKNWRKQVRRLSPRVYDYMMRRYFNKPSISDPAFVNQEHC